MQYQNTHHHGWAASVVARVFDVSLDDTVDQWTDSGTINVSGHSINANHLFHGESYRETAERYSGVLEYKVRRGYSSVCVRDGLVLSVEDIQPISGRIYSVLLDRATSAPVMPLWIHVDIYTRQTSVITKDRA